MVANIAPEMPGVEADKAAAHAIAAMIDHLVARADAPQESRWGTAFKTSDGAGAALDFNDETLGLLAARAGYDPTYFQKIFTRYVGVSPKTFQRYMAYRRARPLLTQGMPTLEAAYAAGLSGNGRLHDLFVTVEAATPGEVASGGRGLDIHYGRVATPLGYLVIGQTPRGVCWAGFQVGETPDLAVARMAQHWPAARLVHDDGAVRAAGEALMAIWRGAADKGFRLPLHVRGTNFQLQVWRALLKIPCGAVVSYDTLAQSLGRPRAARAIGNAVGANPVSLLIPCHRVIQKSGVINNYGWGSPRKKTLLGLEGCTEETGLQEF